MQRFRSKQVPREDDLKQGNACSLSNEIRTIIAFLLCTSAMLQMLRKSQDGDHVQLLIVEAWPPVRGSSRLAQEFGGKLTKKHLVFLPVDEAGAHVCQESCGLK